MPRDNLVLRHNYDRGCHAHACVSMQIVELAGTMRFLHGHGKRGHATQIPDLTCDDVLEHRVGRIFEPQPLHLLIERRAVDAEHLGGMLAVPAVALQHVRE